MKKSLKITALAGALALCLLLSGCYQPPDEVNNGNPSGNTPALFDTMAPTATVSVSVFAAGASPPCAAGAPPPHAASAKIMHNARTNDKTFFIWGYLLVFSDQNE